MKNDTNASHIGGDGKTSQKDQPYFTLISHNTRRTYRGTEHPSKRWGHSVIIYNRSMIIFGGRHSKRSLSNIYSLDFTTLTWSKIDQLGISPPARDSHSAIIYDNEMIIFGGSGSDTKLNDLWSFNFKDKRWKQLASFGDIPVPRDGQLSTVIYDKFMVVFGGIDQLDEDIKTVHLLDLQNFVWILTINEGNEMSLRDSQSICRIGNKCYFFGGQNQNDSSLSNDIYCASFEINENEKLYKTIWNQEIPSSSSPLPSPRSSHSCVSYKDMYIIIIGGEGERGVPLNDIWLYCLNTKYFTQIQLTSKDFEGRFCHSSIVYNDFICIYGGMQNSDITLDSLVILGIEDLDKIENNISMESNNKTDVKNNLITAMSDNKLNAAQNETTPNVMKNINTNIAEVGIDTSDLDADKFYCLEELKQNYLNNIITWNFLKKLSQFSQWPIGCIGDLVHNSLKEEINASNIYIDVKEYQKNELKIPKNDLNIFPTYAGKMDVDVDNEPMTVLSIIDDGRGMNSIEFNQALYSFRQNKNKEFRYFSFGFSLKLSSLRIGDSFVIITKTKNEISIGGISKSLQKLIESEMVFTPIINYKIVEEVVDGNTVTKYVPKSNFPRQTLEIILNELWFMFKNEEELKEYFSSFKTGTHIFIYNLKKKLVNDISRESFEFVFDREENDIYYNTPFEEFSEKWHQYIDLSLVQYLNFFKLKHQKGKNVHIFGKKITLNNPYYNINLLADKSGDAKVVYHLSPDDENKANGFYINGEQYKGVIFNEAFLDNMIGSSLCDIEDIKSKNYFNGVLIYRGNDLVCRVGQSKLGNITYFINKNIKGKEKIFEVNGYVELPIRGYELSLSGKEIKDLAVYGFLITKVKSLIHMINKRDSDKTIVDEKINDMQKRDDGKSNNKKKTNKSKEKRKKIYENAFEANIFANERISRYNKGYTWKKYKDEGLLNKDKLSFSPIELQIVKNLLYNELPSGYRRRFWLIASGAEREKRNNKNYYARLLSKYPRKLPLPFEEEISLDLHRTFPGDPFFKEPENLIKLKNILLAFSMRNITIGYCQGFNYIVGKLLKVFKDDPNAEENCFWIFTQIAENYLPFDFYLKFTGVRTDIEIIKSVLEKTIGTDDNVELCISNLMTKCFVSLFSQSVNDKVLYAIWDAFFIHGNIILYKAFIFFGFYFIKIKEFKDKSIEEIHAFLTEKMKTLEETDLLNYFLLIYNRINDAYLTHFRMRVSSKTAAGTYFNGEHNKELDEKCDRSLPFCLCNKDGGNVNDFSQHNCLRCNKQVEIIDNYFFQNSANPKPENSETDDEVTIDDMLIERQKHICIKNPPNQDKKDNQNIESNKEEIPINKVEDNQKPEETQKEENKKEEEKQKEEEKKEDNKKEDQEQKEKEKQNEEENKGEEKPQKEEEKQKEEQQKEEQQQKEEEQQKKDEKQEDEEQKDEENKREEEKQKKEEQQKEDEKQKDEEQKDEEKHKEEEQQKEEEKQKEEENKREDEIQKENDLSKSEEAQKEESIQKEEEKEKEEALMIDPEEEKAENTNEEVLEKKEEEQREDTQNSQEKNSIAEEKEEDQKEEKEEEHKEEAISEKKEETTKIENIMPEEPENPTKTNEEKGENQKEI